MTDSWRDLAGSTGGTFGLGQLSDGDTVSFTFQDNGEVVDTEYGESAQFHVVLEGSSIELEDLNGDTVEDGEEYYLMTSSSKLLHQFDQLGEELEGTSVSIVCHEGDTDFDREYTVTEE